MNPMIMLTRDAEIAKHILQKNHKNYHKSELQSKYLSRYVGHGLLTSNGDYWLRQRRLIQPAFHRKKIQNLLGIVSDTIDKQVQQITAGKTIDMYPLMNDLAFDVVGRSLFNYQTDAKTLKRLQAIIEELQLFLVKEIRMPYKRGWYKISGKMAYHMKLVAESRKILSDFIEERRASEESHDDLLDMLLNATYEDGSTMDNQTLIDEILILFVAGHETTANALTFTFHLLAKHPEIQDKVVKEVMSLDENLDSLARIDQLKYTKQCIEESMRLYPPAWITDRVALDDDSFGDYTIKKGTLLGVSFYELHRHPKYFKDPLQFRPERFSEENKKETAGYYFPFGAGPRLCIGNGFALFEMMLSVEAVVRKFTLSTTQTEIETNPLVTLKPVGVTARFEPRT